MGSLQDLLLIPTTRYISSVSSVVYVILPVALVAVTTFLKWGTTSTSKRAPPPPGKLAFPILGLGDTMRYLKSFTTLRTRDYVVEKIEETGSPVFKATIFGKTTVFLDAPDGMKMVFTTTDDSLVKSSIPTSFRRLLEFGWNDYRGHDFKALKNHAINHFFGLEVLQGYLPTIERNIVQQMEVFWRGKEDGAVIESHTHFKSLSFGAIAELCVGLTDITVVNKLEPLFAVFAKGMFGLAVNLPGFQFYRSMQADKQIKRILKQHVTRRRKELKEGQANPTQDFLSVLLTCPNENGYFYKDEEIIGNLKTLLWAGHDSNASTLTLVLRYVAQHPEVYEQLIREHSTIARSKQDNEGLTREDLRSMKYTWRVIQESMRVTPVATAIMREAARDFEYKGYSIKKGWMIWCTAAQSSLNPDLIDKPEVFDPSRFEQQGGRVPRYTFFPFGMGHRHCPGMEFGKMVMLVVLHHFMKNFKWTLVNPEARLFCDFLPYVEDGSLLRISRGDYF